MSAKILLYAGIGLAAVGAALTFQAEASTATGLVGMYVSLVFLLGLLEWAFSGWYQERVVEIKEQRRAAAEDADKNHKILDDIRIAQERMQLEREQVQQDREHAQQARSLSLTRAHEAERIAANADAALGVANQRLMTAGLPAVFVDADGKTVA